MNTARTLKQPLTYVRRVFYTGSDAVDQGIGVCFDRDRGTAASVDGERDNYVEKPTTSNNRNFAGVTAKAYSAKTGGQMIEIYEPGSVCLCKIPSNTTINTGIFTAAVGTVEGGMFSRAGFLGRGSVVPLQTQTGIGSALDGSGVTSTKTLTETGAFANSTAGDKVVILGVDSAVTPGVYTIDTVTSENEVELTTAPGDATTGVSFYTYPASDNALVLAKVLDGDESGLQEWINVSMTTGAKQSMVGGITYIGGGVTPTGGDSTATLADGTLPGELKGFKLMGAITTHDYLLTVTSGLGQSNGTSPDGGAALATVEFDADADAAVFQWGLANWKLHDLNGATAAA